MDSLDNENFEFSDFLELGDWVQEHQQFAVYGYPPNQSYVANETNYGSMISNSQDAQQTRGGSGSVGEKREVRGSGSVGEKREVRDRVAFKTKTEIEVLDDGFKWRKYGKKMVKNSPNPRNYFKCSVDGCTVKKRVERDREDSEIVITTYDGVHNHEGPTRF